MQNLRARNLQTEGQKSHLLHLARAVCPKLPWIVKKKNRNSSATFFLEAYFLIPDKATLAKPQKGLHVLESATRFGSHFPSASSCSAGPQPRRHRRANISSRQKRLTLLGGSWDLVTSYNRGYNPTYNWGNPYKAM